MCDLTYVQECKKRKARNRRQVGGCQARGGNGQRKWMKVIHRYNSSVVSPGDAVCSMVTVVNNTASYI